MARYTTTQHNFSCYQTTGSMFHHDDNATVEHDKMTGVLEFMVDRFGIATVLSALADVAFLKKQHLIEAQQDLRGAKQWQHAGNIINAAAFKIP